MKDSTSTQPTLPPELPTGQPVRAPKPNGMSREEFERRAIEQRQRQSMIATAVENSFPSKLRQLLAGAKVHAHSVKGEALAKAVESHAAQVDAITKRLDDDVQIVAKASPPRPSPATTPTFSPRPKASGSTKLSLASRP